MNATTHHETHPDAEMLSAFAEQALDASERAAVLKHLAICGRCREVVALASEAAGVEVAALRHEIARPRKWWRRWSLALAPAAALAATAVAVYVHVRNVERSAEVARLEQQQAIENAPALPQTTPQPPMPAAARAPQPGAPEKTKKTERPDRAGRPQTAEPPAPVAQPYETAAAPPPEVMHGLFSSNKVPSETRESERRREANEALAPSESAPNDTIQTEAAYDEQRKKQAQEELEVRRQLAAKAPMPGGEHDSGSGAPGSSDGASTEPANVSAEQSETQPASEAGLLQFHRQLRSMVDVHAGPYLLHLPGGRPAVSVASTDRRTLAIDKSGELYLSEDSGATWDRVKRQWSGRAVAVRKHANEVDTTGAAPAPTTDENPSAPGAVSQPDTVFELVNDQGQVWLSADGRIWTAK